MAVKSNLLNMALVLTVTCLVCSAVLGGAYVITKAPIEAAKADKVNRANAAVLPAFENSERGETVLKDEAGVETPYVYYKAVNGEELVGYAIESNVSGFGGNLKVLVGITADGMIYDTDVLENNETPGLGAKCAERESLFRTQWRNLNPREKQLALKKGKEKGDIDAITASTITSRAYTQAVFNAVQVFDLLTGEPAGADAATGASVVIPGEAAGEVEKSNNGGQE